MWFGALPGLKVNLEESQLILLGNVEDVVELERILGPSYLHLTLGAPFISIAAWDDLEERMQKRLIFWFKGL